jgi:hypothetical protein
MSKMKFQIIAGRIIRRANGNNVVSMIWSVTNEELYVAQFPQTR